MQVYRAFRQNIDFLLLRYLSEQRLRPMESNLSISNNNGREVTLSENESIQTGQIDDDDIDECDKDYSSDVLFDPNLMKKAVLGKYLWM